MRSSSLHYDSLGIFKGVSFVVAILTALPLVIWGQESKAPAPKPTSRPASGQISGPAAYTAWPFDAREAVKRQDDTAKAMGLRKEVVINVGNKVPMKFILIPAGKFMMGSAEKPREAVMAKPYYMGVYKVTQAQYEAVMGNNPSTIKGKDFPVSSITWKDAVDFCQKASKTTGKKIHPPSEAQWENACRAGANTKFFWGDDESKLGDYAWYRENNAGTMHAVGQKKPNAWGLYDINGLMWEPCRIHEADANTDVTKDVITDYVVRGATWGSRPYMFVLGVSGPAFDDRREGKGLDRYGMRAAMDAD